MKHPLTLDNFDKDVLEFHAGLRTTWSDDGRTINPGAAVNMVSEQLMHMGLLYVDWTLTERGKQYLRDRGCAI